MSGIVKYERYQMMEEKQKVEYLNGLVKTQANLISRTLPNRNQIERFIRSMCIALGGATQRLLNCTPYSIFSSCLNLAYFRLDPSPYLGHGYLVPFGKTATLIIGYKGYVYLMLKSGLFNAVNAEVVYEKDDFALQLGLNRSLTHIPCPPSIQGEPKGAYSTLQYKEGYQDFCWMWLEEINKIRDNSPGYLAALKNNRDHPWITNPDEMRKKTPTRRIIKLAQFPVGDDRFRIASEVDGSQEAGKDLLKQELNIGAIQDVDGNYIEPDPEPTKDNEVTIEADITDAPPTRTRPGKEEKITPEVTTENQKDRLNDLIKKIGEFGVNVNQLYAWFKSRKVKTEAQRINKTEEALELLETGIPWSTISGQKVEEAKPEAEEATNNEETNMPDWMKSQKDEKEDTVRNFVFEQWEGLMKSQKSFVCTEMKKEFPTIRRANLDKQEELQFSTIEKLGQIITSLPED